MFEDDLLGGFGPLTTLRHASLLRWGMKALIDLAVERIPDATDVELWGRPEVGATTKEATGKDYNRRSQGHALLVNARARPTEALVALASRQDQFIALEGGGVVAARLDTGRIKPGVVSKTAASLLGRGASRLSLPQGSLFRGYWDLVGSNGLAIAEQAKHFEESLPLPRTVEVRGPLANVLVEASAEIEGQVTLDARLGPVVIDRGASVENFSRVMGPCYIGPKAKVLSAQIGGGTSIFDSCKVGGQVENSIFLPYANKAHFGYVGDAYVGSWVNLGAGCTFSNLKNTYGNVRLKVSGSQVDTGMLKLGPAIGDMAKLSIGSLVHAGKMVGVCSQVSGNASRDVPSFAYSDSWSGRSVELLIGSVVETQRRMMERRGLTLGRSEESLIRRAFATTRKERKGAGVKPGTIHRS